jgi:hypothetical protein
LEQVEESGGFDDLERIRQKYLGGRKGEVEESVADSMKFEYSVMSKSDSKLASSGIKNSTVIQQHEISMSINNLLATLKNSKKPEIREVNVGDGLVEIEEDLDVRSELEEEDDARRVAPSVDEI